MGITPLGPFGSGSAASSSLIIQDLVITGGSNRVILVSIHTRGNATESEVSSCELQPDGGGTPVATMTEVNDVDSGDIIHVETYALLEDDFPSNGTYDLYITTAGAFQVTAFVQTFQGMKQTIPTTRTYGEALGGGGTSITESDNVVIDVDGSLVTDNVAGDDGGGSGTWSPAGPTRDDDQEIYQYPLSAGVAGTLFDVSDSPITTLQWSCSAFQNRLAMGVIVWEPEGGVPSGPPNLNVYQFGANF